MPSIWNEATGAIETLHERYSREIAQEFSAQDRRLERYCATCHGTGSKDGKHLDCPDCDAAEIIAAHERRKLMPSNAGGNGPSGVAAKVRVD